VADTVPAAKGASADEILEDVMSRQGRLLDVERMAVRGRPTPRIARAVLLVFDIGAVRIEAGEAGIEVSRVERDAEPPDGFEAAREEAPWWALLGSKTPRVWRERDGERLTATHLQFRSDDDNPKIVTLALDEAHLAVQARTRAEFDAESRPASSPETGGDADGNA